MEYNRQRQLIWGMALGAAAAGLTIYLANRQPKNFPPVAPYVDLERYLGDWYDIAHYPQRFQKNCYGTMAHYSLRDDGHIEVVNTCHKGSRTGQLKDIKGKAWVVDKETNARLKVQFFWPFKGDYWIHEVADDYSWSIVGSPDRESLWLLHRSPTPSQQTINLLLSKIEALGYDRDKLEWEEQPPGR